MSVLEWSNVALWILAVLQAVMTVAILRHLAARGGFRRDIAVGDVVSDFERQNVRGASVQLRPNGTVEQRAVFFLSTSCPLCRHVVRAAEELRATMHGATESVFVIHADPANASRFAQDNGVDLDLTIADPNGLVGKTWRIGGKPFMVVVDRDGTVVSCGQPQAHDEVREILTSFTPTGNGGWNG